MNADSPPPIVCPPHRWLIIDATDGRQHWTCQRCGTLQVHMALAPPPWHGGPPQRLPKRFSAPND